MKEISRLSRYYWRVVNGVKNGAKSIFAPKDPVYVYHHIPKCGGTSLRRALARWFVVKLDIGSPDTPDAKLIDVDRLGAMHCLTGHFGRKGYHLAERYPQVWEDRARYKLFTLLRDPLKTKLSLRRYESTRDGTDIAALRDHLLERPNYLASIFPCNQDNYKEVLDRYEFIGILEHSQESLDQLADFLGKPRVVLPHVNKTNSGGDTLELDQSLLDEFRELNALDYAIYEYALAKFEAQRANTVTAR
jgi:hypothetical protein